MDYLDRISEGYEGLLGESLKEKSRRRIDWICEQVQGNTVLDIGCSQGICEILLGRQGLQVTGIDIAQESISYAREMLDKETYEVKAAVQFICADFFTEVNTNKKYDTILLTEILEHLYEPEEMVAKAAECLLDGGRMIVTVPFGINDFPDHKHTFYAADIQNMLSKWVSIENVEFMGGWIGFCGTKTTAPEPFTEVDAVFLKREEEAFYLIERPLRDQLTQAVEKYKKAEENYQTAKKWVADKNQRIESLQATLNSAESTCAVLKEHNVQLEEQKSQLEEQKLQLEEQRSQLEEQKSQLEEQKSQLEEQKSQLEREKTQLEKQKSQLSIQLQGNIEELEREQAFLQTMKRQMQQLNAQLYQVKQQNKIYEERLQKVYGTWYGKIALKIYKILRKIKRTFIHN